MIQAISERNRNWLAIYCKAARVFSVLLLVLIGAGVVYSIVSGDFTDWRGSTVEFILMYIFKLGLLFLLAIFAFCVAQLIDYIVDEEGDAGWLLKNLDKILYLYAFFIIGHKFWYLMFGLSRGVADTPWIMWLSVTLPPLLKALVLVGVGLLVRKMLSIINESKTLV
jgi:hypothetical protein